MDPRNRLLRIQSMVLIGALIVQYALGMWVNLYVSFPQSATEGQLWEFAWSQVPLASHIILAFLILIGAIVLCVRSFYYRLRVWKISSTIGLIAILLAGGSGATFIPSQTALYSYSMSLWFLVALFSFGWGLYVTSPHQKEQQQS
ncbi:MAG: hypothetical protein KGJ34_02790 [Patescibacteria group bacterium]|nr:hypothetical protein [Patescibacteria group bacterium]